MGNIHVARVANILKKWGYVEIVHIGSRHSRTHSLEVTLRKAPDFQKAYDAYRAERAEVSEKRKQEQAAGKDSEEKNAPAEMPALEEQESEPAAARAEGESSAATESVVA